MKKLRETVPDAGSIAGNPLDDVHISGDLAYFASIVDLVCQDPAIGKVIVDWMIARKAFHSMPVTGDYALSTIQQVKQRGNVKPVVFVVDSEGGDPELAAQGASLRAKFGRGGIPAYPSVERAARTLMHLYCYYSRLDRRKTRDLR
jgi:acyl-CoA synthetase (NDP forming)